MAVQYKIIDQSRADMTINVTVEWLDTVRSFSQRGSLNFHLIEGETSAEFRTRVRTECNRIGKLYDQVLGTMNALSADIDQVRNVV